MGPFRSRWSLVTPAGGCGSRGGRRQPGVQCGAHEETYTGAGRLLALGWGLLSRHRSPASCKVTWWLVAHAGRGFKVLPSFAALRLWRQLQPVQVSARGWRGTSSNKSSPWRPPPRGPGNVSRQLGRAGGESVQPVQSLRLSPHTDTHCRRAAREPRGVRLLRGWSWGACSAAESVSGGGDFVGWVSCPSCSWALDAPRTEPQQRHKKRPIQAVLRRGTRADGNEGVLGEAVKPAEPRRRGN